MTELPPVVKIKTENTRIPSVIRVDGKVIRVK